MDGFEHAFLWVYRRAYGDAFDIVGGRAEAEDIAAEVAARAFSRWATIGPYAEPWVVRWPATWPSTWSGVGVGRCRKRQQATVDGGHLERVDLQRAAAGTLEAAAGGG